MKRFFSFLFVLFQLSELAHAQFAPLRYTVMLTAKVQVGPPSITIQWPADTNATNYKVFRKTKTANAWGATLATLPNTSTSFTDYNIVADSGYEYRVTRAASDISGYGYIYSAINLHATDYRGRLILIVDSTFTDSLSSEIFQLMKDISADGWSVVRHDVSRNASPPSVKSVIVNEYNADPINTKAVLLLGHVPVPYSGDLNPDGHVEHLGAWPADVYYADMAGTYSDTYVNDTLASYAANKNRPGDGKFDQTYLPTSLKLQISRIDLSNMPAFPKTEKELLRQYLNRAHDYKFKNFTTIQRGLIADNFSTYGEGFASCGWRNFAPMFGDSAIDQGNYLSTLKAKNYQWSYACGGGWPTGCGGVGSTSDFVNDSIKTVFTMVFGSWFGDWNFQDGFLRAPLAAPGLTLTSCWAGRPYWYFHNMVLGENIGYSTLLSQNNSTTYYTPYTQLARVVSTALMGDLTLRQHVIAPPTNIHHSLSANNSSVQISWDASPDTVDGYYVYRSSSEFGKYERMTPSIITSSTFVDTPPASGLYFYYAKAVKWEMTHSGSYLNTSQGISDSVTIIVSSIAPVNGENDIILFPNPTSEKLYLNGNLAKDEKIEIQNLLGQTLLTKTISSNSNQAEIDVKDLASGIYILVIKNKEGSFIKKFVKE